jgi:RimJ/RimL family protein N-acetyltransferase
MNVLTPRLHVRDLLGEDWRALHSLRIDPLVHRFNHFGPESESETRTWVRETMESNASTPRLAHNCAIVLRATGEVIGWIGFGTPSAGKEQYGEIDFGYALRPADWGHGYTTEALKAMIGFIFAELPVQRIFGECNVANPASARVMEKAGMIRTAHFIDPEEREPVRAESYRYAIDRGAWEARTRTATG